jgi:prephenate dehydrogenase
MHIAVVGPGLIGRSVTLASRHADPSRTVTELDRGDSLARARGAEIIVLATPVDIILEIIQEHASVLRDSIVIDTGSTKRVIVAAARERGIESFVGGHPMAGAATSGPSGARADLFAGRPWFLVPAKPGSAALTSARAFVEQLQAVPVVMTDGGEEHDRAMAAVSHLPQLIASALMSVVAEAAGTNLQWAGNGLRDTTRLAQSSPEMWHSILETNADQLSPLLQTLSRTLASLAAQLGDGQAAREIIAEGRRARALLDLPESDARRTFEHEDR